MTGKSRQQSASRREEGVPPSGTVLVEVDEAGNPGGEFPGGESRTVWPVFFLAGKLQGKEFQGPRQEWLSRNRWGELF